MKAYELGIKRQDYICFRGCSSRKQLVRSPEWAVGISQVLMICKVNQYHDQVLIQVTLSHFMLGTLQRTALCPHRITHVREDQKGPAYDKMG